MLVRNPEARAISLSVQKLLDRAQKGQLRIPAFQRPLKWTIKDNLLLLDSVARGFPIGTLLFWEKPMPAGRVTLGAVEIDAPADHRAWLIVDGQQRISALVGSMLRTGSERDAFGLAYDLMEGRFHALADSKRRDRSVPVSVLGSPERLLRWLEESGIRERIQDASDRAFKISTSLRDYEIAAYVIDTQDEATVREVFDRLNTRGRKLTKSEVFEAIDHAEPTGHTVAEIQTALDDLRFGRLDKNLILKSLAAVHGEDTTQAFRPRWTKREREATWERTLQGLRRAIVFLRRDGGVPHISLLPYPLPLVVLAKFFALHPEPHPRNGVLLRRWLWRGFIHGTHQGQSIPLVRKMMGAVSESEDESVQALLRTVRRDRAGLDIDNNVNLKTARTRIEILLLLQDGPRSFESGDPIDVVSVLERFGPSGLLAQIDENRVDQVGRGMGNRIIVEGKRPKALDALPETALKMVMKSQHVLTLDTSEDLGERMVELSGLLADIANRLMGVDEPDRGPIRTTDDEAPVE